ncbi:MAG: DNA alkylation repair protein [Candidatus Omnitrophota bacterium]
MTQEKISKELKKYADKEKAKTLQKFFKTGPGEYAEGDIFLGIQVPVLRKLAKKYSDLNIPEVVMLLKSRFHEERLFALLVLMLRYAKSSTGQNKKTIYTLYLAHSTYINNWDLVDLSAAHIVGAFLEHRSKNVLYRLAKSESMWQRRIAIISTFHFIKHGRFNETLKIARLLIKDREDLIHKAVGWMLREVGKRDINVETEFLRTHYNDMPRTMLRYAIERFPANKRKAFLRGLIA